MQRVRRSMSGALAGALALGAVLATGVVSGSARAERGTVTLEEVVKAAQNEPPRVMLALATLQRRGAEAGVAMGAYYPTLNAQVSGTVSYNNSPVTNVFRSNAGNKSVAGQVSADFAIVNLARSSNLASARATQRAEDGNVNDVRRQAVAAAVELYVRALSTGALIEDATLTFERRSQQYSAIQGLVHAGLRPSVDETRAQVEAVAARYRLDVRRLEQLASFAALAAAVGRDPEDGASPAELPSDPFRGPPSTEEAVRFAIRQRPDLRRYEQVLQARQQDVRTAVRRRAPILGISAQTAVSSVDTIDAWTKQVCTRDPTDPEAPPTCQRLSVSGRGLNASGMVYLRWSGLDATVIRSADVARGAMLEAQRALEAAQLDLRAQVVDAIFAVERAKKEVDRATEVLGAAGATREAQLGRYKAGVASLLELLDAESLEQNARLARIESTRDYDVARVRLLGAIGSIEGVH